MVKKLRNTKDLSISRLPDRQTASTPGKNSTTQPKFNANQKYCTCLAPLRGLHSVVCRRCGLPVTKAEACPTCGGPRRFWYKTTCPLCDGADAGPNKKNKKTKKGKGVENGTAWR